MRSEPVRLDEISLYFTEISTRRDENVPHEHEEVGQPDKPGQSSLNNIRTFVLHNDFTSLFIVKWLHVTVYCKNYLIKQSFFSGITNFLIELRQKNPYERGIKIISPWKASPPNRATLPPYKQPLRLLNSQIFYMNNGNQYRLKN